ncbi:putative Zn(2)-C6 fungal-type domain-containing protein [Seiridium cardinale]|uniref:Zn(2)-C6 fungal-type domain-containing protein n=1 Tax=Seiridium cardinale TaxID=138064 RepID=A0ABR2Y270_9PEZI
MAGPVRSKHGCWTCRLRKKKCDENRPQCLTCEALTITCYGYGTKPDWMDSGEQERVVANGLKQIVKINSRKKPAVQRTIPSGAPLKLAPKSSPGSSRQSTTDPTSGHPPSNNPVSDQDIQREGTAPSTPEDKDDESSSSTSSMSASESILLMHFIDNVFPLQYPAYKPEMREGGRGWLLHLLLQTKPLYHAALALSSYHRLVIMYQNASPECRLAATVQQEQQLEKCLNEVQRTIGNVSQFVEQAKQINRMGIATSIVQLVFFELFAGDRSVWQVHLNAAIDMYERCCRDHVVHLGLSEKTQAIILHDLPLGQDGAEVNQEVVTFRFIAGTIIWLDLIASITTGNAPRLLQYHSVVIGPDSQTRLESIMGCQNWLMIQIGRIAKVQQQKTESKRLGRLNSAHFDHTMAHIGKQIGSGLMLSDLADFELCEANLCGPHNTMLGWTTSITRMFAHMASVYLHLVTHGFHKLELLTSVTTDAIEMVRTRFPRNLLPAVVCPLFVIGCVAKPGEEQQVFGYLFSSPPLLDPLLNHRAKALPTLEAVWNRRELSTCFTWEDTIQLSHDLLLI